MIRITENVVSDISFSIVLGLGLGFFLRVYYFYLVFKNKSL